MSTPPVGVSVVIPVRDRAVVLRRALASVAEQTAPCAEVVVVDDGSTEDLSDALTAHPGLPVRLVRHPRSLGAAAARNSGVAAADGEWIAFLDSDDTWAPGKLEAQLAATVRAGAEASCTSFALVRGARRTVRRVGPERAGLLRVAEGATLAPGSTLLVRRAAVEEVGGYDTGLARLEDWDWLLRYASTRTLLLLDAPLSTVHVGTSPDAAVVLDALAQIRATHVPHLPPRERRTLLATLALERAAVHARARRVVPAAALTAAALLRHPAHARRVLDRLRG